MEACASELDNFLTAAAWLDRFLTACCTRGIFPAAERVTNEPLLSRHC